MSDFLINPFMIKPSGSVTSISQTWIPAAKTYTGTTFSTINPTNSITIGGTNLSGATQVSLHDAATLTDYPWGTVTSSTSTSVTFTASSISLLTAKNYRIKVSASAGTFISSVDLLSVIGWQWHSGASSLTNTILVHGNTTFGNGRAGIIYDATAPGYTPRFEIVNGPMPVQTDICCIGAGGTGGTSYKTGSSSLGRGGGGGGGGVAVTSYAANTLTGISTSGALGFNSGSGSGLTTTVVWGGNTTTGAGGGRGGNAPSGGATPNGVSGGCGGGGGYYYRPAATSGAGGSSTGNVGTQTYGGAGGTGTQTAATGTGYTGGSAIGLATETGIQTLSISGGNAWNLGNTYAGGGKGGLAQGSAPLGGPTRYGFGGYGGGCAGGTTLTTYSPANGNRGAIFIGFPL